MCFPLKIADPLKIHRPGKKDFPVVAAISRKISLFCLLYVVSNIK